MAELVKQFKDVTLEYEGGSATLYISTDMPGGTMAVRRTISMPQAATRKAHTFPLESGGALLEGKLIQFKVVSQAAVILQAGSIRLRKVGTYIDGVSGDIWETQPLSFD